MRKKNIDREIENGTYVKSFIWSVALYGSETWPIKATDKKHLQAFELIFG